MAEKMSDFNSKTIQEGKSEHINNIVKTKSENSSQQKLIFNSKQVSVDKENTNKKAIDGKNIPQKNIEGLCDQLQWREKFMKSQKEIEMKDSKILEQEKYIKTLNAKLILQSKNSSEEISKYKESIADSEMKLKERETKIEEKNELIGKLRALGKSYRDEATKYKTKIGTYENTIKEHAETIRTKEERHEQMIKEKEVLKDELLKSEKSIALQKSNVNQLNEKCKQKEEQIKSITRTDVDTKIAELDQKLSQKNAEHEKYIKDLEDELNIISDELMTANEKLKQELKEKDTEISELQSKLQLQSTQINQMKISNEKDSFKGSNDQNEEVETVVYEYFSDEEIQFDANNCEDLRTLLRKRKESGDNEFEISDIEDKSDNNLDTNNIKVKVRFDDLDTAGSDSYKNYAKRVKYQNVDELELSDCDELN